MTPTVVSVIFARGGSKGIVGKNLRLLAGKPLVAHAIEAARASRWIGRVVVSTDDPAIAEVAVRYGAEAPFLRPRALAQDDSPEWLAWQHAIQMLTGPSGRAMDAFVSVPPTSPLRAVEDIDACIEVLLEGDADVVITVTPADRNPYFNMVTFDDERYARLVLSSPQPVHRRQAAPPVFSITTVAYAARPGFVLSANSLFEGKVKAVVVPQERALDIDTELDLRFAEFLLTQSSMLRHR